MENLQTIYHLPRDAKLLKPGTRIRNKQRYGCYFPTLGERESWVTHNSKAQYKAVHAKVVAREHLLDIREAYPDKRQVIAPHLRAFSNQIKEITGTL